LVPVKVKGKTNGRPEAKVGHVGHRQAMLPPTRTAGASPDAGKLVRRLQSERENFWLFLRQECVSATNNHAERLLRFAVLWIKSSLGTASEKGDRWVERILFLGQTCRMRRMRTFPVLVDAVKCPFQEKAPGVAWI